MEMRGRAAGEAGGMGGGGASCGCYFRGSGWRARLCNADPRRSPRTASACGGLAPLAARSRPFPCAAARGLLRTRLHRGRGGTVPAAHHCHPRWPPWKRSPGVPVVSLMSDGLFWLWSSHACMLGISSRIIDGSGEPWPKSAPSHVLRNYWNATQEARGRLWVFTQPTCLS